MNGIIMNKDTGRKLRELCRPYMSGKHRWEFVAHVRIKPDLLEQYFKGKRDVSTEHLCRLADACRMDLEAFKCNILAAYKTEEEKKLKAIKAAEWSRQVEEARIQREKEKQEHAIWYREWCEANNPDEVRKIRQKEALHEQTKCELREYGIDREINRIHVDDLETFLTGPYAYPLKYIMCHLEHNKYLPRLESLLRTCSDEDLVYQNTNALMWACGGELAYEELLLLKDRKEFIAAHIHTRGPEGKTTLHYAAGGAYDTPRAIRLLVEWGADVNAKDDFLWTPLHNAACRNQDNDGSWAVLREFGAKYTVNKAGDTPEDIQNRLDAIDAW